MKLSEMRAIHEASTTNEWEHDTESNVVCDVMTGLLLAECTLLTDGAAIAVYHNTYAKLVALAEASVALRHCGMQFDDAHTKAEVDWMAAVNALEAV